MKTSHSILLDLTNGQATCAVIAERMRQPERIVAAFLADLEIDGLAESFEIGQPTIGRKLIGWRITPSGKALASNLQTPCTP